MPVYEFTSADYRGAYFHSAPMDADVISSFAGIRSWLDGNAAIPSLGRHRLAAHALTWGGVPVCAAIKAFSRGSWIRDRDFARRGSKAERSFRAAVRLHEHGVGTPRPLAFIDRWIRGRLVESYYLCEFLEDTTSLRDELDRLYRDDPLCRRIMALMEVAALAIADMHDAGLCHYDLGNQNILLRRIDPDTWGDVKFIDLNRARISDALTLADRARDISRIDLPSDFLRVFKCMYFRHQHPPAEFNRLEEKFRRRFALHTATRKYRHPIREARQRKLDALNVSAPRGRELWVWDDRSEQAVSTLLSKDRHPYYPAINNWYVATGLLKSVLPAHRHYKELRGQCFKKPVALSGRIGLAIGSAGNRDDQEGAFLKAFTGVPVLVRISCHETEEKNGAAVERARKARADGHAVMIALLQDRAAIRDPGRWQSFVSHWMPQLKGVADWVEVGHAVNRVKWGMWDVREYGRLIEPVLRQAHAMGGIKLAGPAAIDFEYHFLPALLNQIPGEGVIDALSHHLYVDRRGAPENRQGAFSAVEKFALLKAVAASSSKVRGGRVIVSEVNWPILGTGEYSPVNSPYIIPGSHTNDPSVDEETYANYMIRYYALALCSGMVDQVYWWRLVARGFGLIDDREGQWRARPAYFALEHFVRELGSATFVERMKSPDESWVLRFERATGGPVVLAWSNSATPVSIPAPCRLDRMIGRDGMEIGGDRDKVLLSQSPVYLIGAKN